MIGSGAGSKRTRLQVLGLGLPWPHPLHLRRMTRVVIAISLGKQRTPRSTRDGRHGRRINCSLFFEKIASTARGAFVYTLLSGKALEAVEHLEPSAYHKEKGEDVLFGILDRRFPEKEATDEMSENLTAIFNLKANEGEPLKTWINRAPEAFEKLNRKAQVNFPDEARGWLILHRSGLYPPSSRRWSLPEAKES